MPRTLAGYYPIMATPFKADGSVDLAGVRRLTEFLIGNGAQGMSPNGGASEARHLAEDERNRILDIVMEANAGRTGVLVGCSAPSTEESARLCQYAQKAGADAVFVMPPENWQGMSLLEPRVPSDQMLAHYQTICEGLDIPMMIHAVAAMTPEWFLKLMERVPTVKYIKEETTQNNGKLRELIRAVGDHITIFGPGYHYPAELEWGARGVMPSCVAPRTRSRIFDLWEQGKKDEARELWNRMLPVYFWQVNSGHHIEAGKHYLVEMGVFQAAYSRPETGKLSLDEADIQEMRRALASLGQPPL